MATPGGRHTGRSLSPLGHRGKDSRTSPVTSERGGPGCQRALRPFLTDVCLTADGGTQGAPQTEVRTGCMGWFGKTGGQRC